MKTFVVLSLFSLLFLSAIPVEAQDLQRCPTCRGKGLVLVVKCTNCDGTGRCPACGGTGFKGTASLSPNKVGCLVCRSTGQCKTCNGTGGTMGKCTTCDGTRMVPRQAGPNPPPGAPAVPRPPIPKPVPQPVPRPQPPPKPERNSGFGDVIKDRAGFVDRVLEANVCIFSGNPAGVVAGVTASPAPGEVAMLVAKDDDVSGEIVAFLERGKTPRKALITYSVVTPDNLVVYSITEAAPAEKQTSATP